MNLAFFEDDLYENFLPLTYTRPVYDLRCGIDELHKKICRVYPEAKKVYFTRDYLAPVFAKKLGAPVNDVDALDDDTVFVNGRLLPSERLKEVVQQFVGKNVVALQDGQPVLISLKSELCREHGDLFLTPLTKDSLLTLKGKAEFKEVKGLTLLEYPWDLIEHNGELIKEEFSIVAKGEPEGEIDERAVIYGDPKNLYVAKGAFIEAGVVIDVRGGPIYIGEDSYVQTISRLEGPSYLGRDNRIFGAQIREGCSFGDVCRIGGEVEETIIQGYTNKRHLGFVGHAYIGQWVNLGALTTNSDLKNDYSSVQVYVKGKFIDSGITKLGCFIGDHAKTSIGCLLNTGTVIGVMSNVLAGGEATPKFIPSFCWYFRNRFSRGRGLRKMIETARVVMSRRGVTLTEEEIKLYERLYEITREEREKLIRRSRAKLRRKQEADIKG